MQYKEIDLPTKPGWYWVRKEYDERWKVREAWLDHDVLRIELSTVEQFKHNYRARFAGPIEPPE